MKVKCLPTGMEAIFICGLILINILIYLPAINGEFIWDDKDLVLNNTLIQNPTFLKSFLFQPYFMSSPTDNSLGSDSSQTQFYRPIAMLSLWLDFKIWGFNPNGFHITNIFLHLLCVVLFFTLLLKLDVQKFWAFFSALLFSVFPFHFENVAWISGRTDILSFLFAAIASLFLLNYLKNHKLTSLIFSALFYFISLLAKENCIFLFLIFLLFCIKKRKSFKQTLIIISPYVAMLFAWVVMRSFVVNPMSIQVSFKSIKNIFAALGFYIYKSFVPLHLSVSINTQQVFPNLIFQLLGVLIVLGTTFFILKALYKKAFTNNNLILAIIIFFMLLLPSIIVLVMETSSSLLAWRFLYASSAVFLGILTHSLGKLLKSKKIFVAVMIGLSIIYISEIFPKNAYFGQKERDFWLNMKNVENESIIVQYNSASIQLWYNEQLGLSYYESILNNWQGHPLYHHYKLMIMENCATFYTRKGDFTKAKYYFDQIKIQNRVSGVEFLFNYANYLYLTGEKSKAESTVRDLLEKYPSHHNILFMAAKFYIFIKEEEKALQLLDIDYSLHHFQESLQMLNQLKKKMSSTKNFHDKNH